MEGDQKDAQESVSISPSCPPRERTAQVSPHVLPANAPVQTGQDPSSFPDTVDRQRTIARYVAAAKFLEAAIQGREDGWEQCQFPELVGELESDSDLSFRNKVSRTLDAWSGNFKDQTARRKCLYALQCFRTAWSDFILNFVRIAEGVESVTVHCLFSLI